MLAKASFTIFLLGLLGGLIALLTPCVFPMIPVTVSYFTNKSHNKKRGKTNAILYGLFIFLIYVLITIPFHLANDTISPEIFNNISTNIWLNLLFFVIFVVFAISFFGFFEIGLPSSIANKADSKSGHGKYRWYIFYGWYISHCFLLLHWAHSRNIARWGGRPRCMATYSRRGRIWYGIRIAFCIVCDVSKLA